MPARRTKAKFELGGRSERQLLRKDGSKLAAFEPSQLALRRYCHHYRRRAAAMPSINAIAKLCSGAPRTNPESVSSDISGASPAAFASLSLRLADRTRSTGDSDWIGSAAFKASINSSAM